MSESSHWPSVEIDTVEQLRAVARSLPHVHWVEATLDAPYDAVWAVVSDLEAGVPRFETIVQGIRILSANGERLEVESRIGFVRFLLDVVLRDGLCVMHNRRVDIDIGMAAAPAGSRTRVAHFEGSRGFGWLMRPYYRWALPRELAQLESIARASDVRRNV